MTIDKLLDALRQCENMLSRFVHSVSDDDKHVDGRRAICAARAAIAAYESAGNATQEAADTYADPDCPGCRGGDKVPFGSYFVCPVCSSEWFGDDEVQP